MSSEPTPLILFSGLAADANIFAPQKAAFSQLMVPEWPIPARGETLEDYCERIAETLPSQRHCVIGGASFGGIVAQGVAQHLQPLAVILIGSVRSPSELPLYARMARPLRFIVPLVPVRLLQCLSAPFTSRLARRLSPHLWGVMKQFRGSDPRVLKWSLCRILDWRSAARVDCPVYHIHGMRDHVLPSKRTQPDQLIHGGGHIVSLTHPAEVNAFIRKVLEETRSAAE